MKLNIEKLKEVEGCKETQEYIDQFYSFLLGINITDNEKFKDIEITKRRLDVDIVRYNISATYKSGRSDYSYFSLFIQERDGNFLKCFISVRNYTDKKVDYEKLKGIFLKKYGIEPSILENLTGFDLIKDIVLTGSLNSYDGFLDTLMFLYEEMFEEE